MASNKLIAIECPNCGELFCYFGDVKCNKCGYSGHTYDNSLIQDYIKKGMSARVAWIVFGIRQDDYEILKRSKLDRTRTMSVIEYIKHGVNSNRCISKHPVFYQDN